MHSHHDHTEGAASVSAGEAPELEAARALLAQEEQHRMETCAAEIQAVLERHGMRMEVTPAQIVLAPQ